MSTNKLIEEIEWDAGAYDRKYSGVNCLFRKLSTNEVFSAYVHRIFPSETGEALLADLYLKPEVSTRVELPTGVSGGRIHNFALACIPVYTPVVSRWYPADAVIRGSFGPHVLLTRRPRKGFLCGLSRNTHSFCVSGKDGLTHITPTLKTPVEDLKNVPEIKVNPEAVAKKGYGVLDNLWSVNGGVLYLLASQQGEVKGSRIYLNNEGVADAFRKKYGDVWTVNYLPST